MAQKLAAQFGKQRPRADSTLGLSKHAGICAQKPRILAEYESDWTICTAIVIVVITGCDIGENADVSDAIQQAGALARQAKVLDDICCC